MLKHFQAQMPHGLVVPDVREPDTSRRSPLPPEVGPMAITLTPEEISYLEQLVPAGKRGRTISAPTPRGGLKRLVKAGYVTDHAVSMDAVLYVITDLGRQALAKAKGRAGGG